ncbi:hypothetical protein EV401DRAFT_1946134 [Pisolithus croceorrhizus]|nr:hypothetical protein EV401DRAFT_1946134 [Pisolithus croceorrhizus]
MIGCAVLPHFHSLVDCIAHGLADEQRKAQQLHPYGIESFDKVLRPLWLSIGQHCEVQKSLRNEPRIFPPQPSG